MRVVPIKKLLKFRKFSDGFLLFIFTDFVLGRLGTK